MCIQFGVAPVTVFFGFGDCVITDIKATHAEFIVWLRGFFADIQMTVIIIVIIVEVSCIVGCGERIFLVTMTVKMNRVVRIFMWVSVPCGKCQSLYLAD